MHGHGRRMQVGQVHAAAVLTVGGSGRAGSNLETVLGMPIVCVIGFRARIMTHEQHRMRAAPCRRVSDAGGSSRGNRFSLPFLPPRQQVTRAATSQPGEGSQWPTFPPSIRKPELRRPVALRDGAQDEQAADALRGSRCCRRCCWHGCPTAAAGVRHSAVAGVEGAAAPRGGAVGTGVSRSISWSGGARTAAPPLGVPGGAVSTGPACWSRCRLRVSAPAAAASPSVAAPRLAGSGVSVWTLAQVRRFKKPHMFTPRSLAGGK
jgi:hypothetical protein